MVLVVLVILETEVKILRISHQYQHIITTNLAFVLVNYFFYCHDYGHFCSRKCYPYCASATLTYVLIRINMHIRIAFKLNYYICCCCLYNLLKISLCLCIILS